MSLTCMCCLFWCAFLLLVQFNPLLRDIFGLGPPLILDAAVKSNKISRFEKVTASLPSLNLNLHTGTIRPWECAIAFFTIFLLVLHHAAVKVQVPQNKKTNPVCLSCTHLVSLSSSTASFQLSCLQGQD